MPITGSRAPTTINLSGGIGTLVDGAASAEQKVITVDSTTGFVAGAAISYPLAGGATEYNIIATVDSGTQLTATTNIGTGGIANNAYLAMIANSERSAALSIPYGNGVKPTLPDVVDWITQGWYSIEAYGGSTGATGTANRAALDAAMAAADAAGGGIVYIPPGTWTLRPMTTASPTYSGYDNIHVMGAGMGASKILWEAGDWSVGAGWGDTAMLGFVNSDDLYISDLTLDGNRANHTGTQEQMHCLRFNQCDYVRVERVEMRRPKGDGIYYWGNTVAAEQLWVRDNYFYDSDRNGITIQRNVKNVMISGNRFESISDGCIDFEPTGEPVTQPANFIVDGNLFLHDTATQVCTFYESTGPQQIMFVNNVVHDGGIQFFNVSRGVIANNIFQNTNASYANPTLHFSHNGTDITVIGNFIRHSSSSSAAIYSQMQTSISHQRLRIVENHILVTASARAIYCVDLRSVTIRGNHIRCSATTALQAINLTWDTGYAAAGYSNPSPVIIQDNFIDGWNDTLGTAIYITSTGASGPTVIDDLVIQGNTTDNCYYTVHFAVGNTSTRWITNLRLEDNYHLGSSGKLLKYGNDYLPGAAFLRSRRTQGLTSGAGTDMFHVFVPTGNIAGGVVNYVIRCTDGTEVQGLTGTFQYSAYNKSGTPSVTINSSSDNQSNRASSGSTLSAAFSGSTSGNKLTIVCTPTTSLTPTTFTLLWSVDNLSYVDSAVEPGA